MKGDIASLEGKALQMAGKRTDFQTPTVLAKMKEILERRGAKIDPETGRVLLPVEMARENLENVSGRVTESNLVDQYGRKAEIPPADEATVNAAKGALSRAKVKESVAFGAVDGKRQYQWLADRYEELHAANKLGGVNLSDTLDFLDLFKSETEFGKIHKAPEQLQEAFGQLYNSAAQDRALNLGKVFNGTGLHEEKMYKEVYKKFTDNIDAHRQFSQIFENARAAGDFVKYNAPSAELLELLRDKVLGEGSEHWKRLRGEYLHDIIHKSTEPTTGIFSGQSFLSKLHGMPPDVKKALFKDNELKMMSSIARVSEKIPFADILTPEMKRALDVWASAMPGSFAVTKIRGLFAVVGKNYDALKYLESESFRKMELEALRGGDMVAVRQAANARKYLGDMVKRMNVVEVMRANKLVRLAIPMIPASTKAGFRVMKNRPMKDSASTSSGMPLWETPPEPEI
jgi:hypothetical protein